MTSHAILSPSAAERWSVCPGSVYLAKGVVDTSSSYADEGTVAHMVAERALFEGTDAVDYVGQTFTIDPTRSPIMFTEDMAEAVQKYVDYVRQASVGAELFVEEQYDISHVIPECFGTSDATIIHPDGELHVVDLKFGMGVEVSAMRNLQMAAYALGAVRRFALTHDVQAVRMTVHQPRINNVSEWATTLDELEEIGAKLKSAGEYAIKFHYGAVPTPDDFTPDEKACRFCPAKGNCEALTRFALSTLADDFVDLNTVDEKLPAIVDAATERIGVVDNDILGRLMGRLDLIEGWAKAVRARVESELLAGREVFGHKLVEGRKGRREWVDPTEVEETFKRMRLKKDEMYDFKIISPTAAEKLFKTSPRKWDRVRDLITQSTGKPSVAPLDDPRPALVVAPLDDFDNLETSDAIGAESLV